MNEKLFQWNYEIDGLIPKHAKLKRKLWLRKNKILLEKKGEVLNAFVLGDEKSRDNIYQITTYLRMTCLVSHNAPDVSGGSSVSISSADELGKKNFLKASFSISHPEEATDEIEHYAPKFIRFIGKLHDKYIDIIKENDFLEIAMDYFYEAEKKFVYSDEGFISAMISMDI